MKDPWYRLNRWHTLSSYRHEACRDEPTAPRDYLDFVLKSEYDHIHEFHKSKAEVALQRDTLNKSHKSVASSFAEMFAHANYRVDISFADSHEIKLRDSMRLTTS